MENLTWLEEDGIDDTLVDHDPGPSPDHGPGLGPGPGHGPGLGPRPTPDPGQVHDFELDEVSDAEDATTEVAAIVV